jgi:hypothetical protein
MTTVTAVPAHAPQDLLAGWVTTTLFETVGLFAGALVLALSSQLQLPILGIVALMIWFLALWAENYSVATLTVTRFGQSKPISILMMSLAEFVTYSIWLALLLTAGLHWLILFAVLVVLTQVHHAVQFCYFFPNASFVQGMRNPLLLVASVIEAVAGQALLAPLIGANLAQMTFSGLILPFIGLLVLFAIEHLVGGRVTPT